jgi:hypothetical protein
MPDNERPVKKSQVREDKPRVFPILSESGIPKSFLL